MNIESNELVLPGKLVLWRRGYPVWCGDIGSPIEDVEWDRMTLNPVDYQRIKDALASHGT